MNANLSPTAERDPNCPVCGQHSSPLTPAALAVLAERQRQVLKEGWTAQHDDEHDNGALAKAAACYALGRDGVSGGTYPHDRFIQVWPWSTRWWKPRDERSNLIKAGALILAEIERLDRAAIAAATSGVA